MAHKSISLTGQKRQRNVTFFAQEKKKKKKPKKERALRNPVKSQSIVKMALQPR